MALQHSETADTIIGYSLAIILGVSLVGNVSAFFYFWPNRRKSLPNKLYILIVIVDIITSISTVPVISSLLNDRKPSLFSSSALCWTYTMAANYSVRMSMLLVAVLSITRTIAIVFPHKVREIKTKLVVMVIGGYAVFMIIIDGVFLAQSWFTTEYNQFIVSCILKKSTETIPLGARNFYVIKAEIEIFAPSVAVFVSFIIGIVALMKKKVSPIASNKAVTTAKRSRQVSVTIALFAAVFLVCNTPAIIIYSLSYSAAKYSAKVREFIGETKWYGYLMMFCFPLFLNAALNPCLYLIRMPRYKDLTKQRISLLALGVSSTWISMRSTTRE